MLEFYQRQKERLEQALKDMYSQMLDAGIGTIGDYKNKIILLEGQLKDINNKIAGEAKKEVFNNEGPQPTPAPQAQPPLPAGIRRIKIFLASSSELKTERDQFEIFINRENKRLVDRGVFLELIVWEDFLDAISQTRLQDEYDGAIKTSQIFVSLFATRAGMYTEEEFDIALNQFRATGKPLIYTYFRNSNIDQAGAPEMSLSKFKDKLVKLGHYAT